MRSLRTQLVIWLVGGTLVLTCAAGIGLYGYMEEVLERSLDAALAAKSEAIASAVHMEEDGKPHLLQSDPFIAVTNRHEGPFFFQIWFEDGKTLCRSVPPDTTNELPRITNPRRHFQDAKLADATTVRITQIWFTARADEDEPDSPLKSPRVLPAHLLLVVAHDRRSIDGTLAVLLSGLLVAAIVVTAGILVIVPWCVARGLRPLADVSRLADQIGPETLQVRFPGSGNLPPELQPIGLKLNDLLDRLSTAFARERRFTAAVAHELRTPLAELRSACDVALRWPEDVEGLRTAFSEVRDVAVQMTTMVQTLLSLTRQQSPELLPAAPVHLASSISKAWPELPTAALQRQLALSITVEDTATVHSNPDLLAAVLRNLIGNAVDYTPAGGTIYISSMTNQLGRWSLRISNNCEGLTREDLPRLFEPFWRADASRTGTGHTGLGLSLVKAYCELMGATIAAELPTDHQLAMTLHFPPVTSETGAARHTSAAAGASGAFASETNGTSDSPNVGFRLTK